ncbi:helix-turn-helix domain-containing protein [Malaciobacter marinus]|uniref:helix-turn-helix domain-containing protein n=1 Tax=Malaciobacter marinus TaxID=505249 RepID=UPI003B0005DC
MSLTKLEKKLLEVLVHNKTHVVTYEMIENFVWQEKGATQEVIRAYIKKLRKKTYQELIENIQGIGYLLKI